MLRISRPVSFCALLFLLLHSFSVLAAKPVWIDSDPACDGRSVHDIDDCWALTRALQEESLVVRGISTVFGNSSEANSFDVLIRLLGQVGHFDAAVPVFRGASQPLAVETHEHNEAAAALAAALGREPITIITLGPLTNIASLIHEYPEVIPNIASLVVVAGQRPEQGARFHPGSSQLFHVHDFNFRKDVEAFQLILDAELPLTLLPYEVAAKVLIGGDDLSDMSAGGAQGAMLAGLAEPWLKYWKSTFRKDGFHPFDSLAVGYVIEPKRFRCESLPASIERRRSLFLGTRDRLLVSESLEGGARVNYCFEVAPSFKGDLLLSLQG